MANDAYQVFVATDGTALEGGKIYIGEANNDPQLKPVALFWDAAKTVTANQPLRTSGGVIVRDGTPADVFANVDGYSIRVRDRNDQLVWYKSTTGGIAVDRLTFPIPSGPAGASSTVPGPADNTYSDLAAFKASDIGRKTASLVSVANVKDGRFNWTPGNYTGKADDANVIKANSTALSVGAWVRQTFQSLSFGMLESNSAAIGAEALTSVTTGVRNTAFGYQALKLNASGNENTAYGYRALASVVGGTDPVANYNTAFGSYALASMTSGYKNTAFGRATSDMLTTGYQNTALGYGAFHWATAAVNCVAVGYEAVHGGDGSVPLTQQGLVGVGFQALYECTGDFNTAVGTSAGRNITTGARNTALGTNALNQQVTASDNIGVGYGAGLNNTGSGNIFLGVNADAAAGLANVTVIGTGAQATLPNTFILGVNQAILPGGVASDIGSQAKPWAFGIFNKAVYAHSATAPTAGGVTGAGFLLSSTPNFGIFFGSGTPSLSAARGSLYLRTDGSSTSSRLYVNLDNGSGWTAVTTAS